MNPRPKSTWLPSPNFTPKSLPRKITCVVIHATATDSKESPLGWLTNKNSGVSAHYLIDRLGMIYYLVDEANVSWHAGNSQWKGEMMCNKFSVGVELVNGNDGIMPYPPEQLDSCADLTAAICKDHNITASDVVGHCDIAPGRKTDPAGFPWGIFREMLLMRGLGV